MRIKKAVLKNYSYECEVVEIHVNEIDVELAFVFKEMGITLYKMEEIYEENHTDFYFEKYNEFKKYVEENTEEVERKIYNLLRLKMMMNKGE